MSSNKSISILCLLYGIIASTSAINAASLSTLKVQAVQRGVRILVTTTAAHSLDFHAARIQILFHLAGHQRGYAGAPGGPFDILIEDNIVYRHQGPAAAWGWRKIGSASSQRKGKSLRTRIDLALLVNSVTSQRNKKARISVRLLTSQWKLIATGQTTCTLSSENQAAKTKSLASVVGKVPLHAQHLLSARKRMAAAESYYCYYGNGEAKRLAKYDVVILHVPEMSIENIRRLDRLGVVTLGYLSIGETSRLVRGNAAGPGGYASWYFDHQRVGEPDENKNWHSYYANCGDPAWRARCMRSASELLQNDGFSGLFLDCVNNYELYPHTQDRAGTIKLIAELRSHFPHAVIVVNQGFKILPKVAPWIDGVMLESFTLSWRAGKNGIKEYVIQKPSTLNWSSALVRDRIDPIISRHPLKLLALDYALPAQTRRIQMAKNRAATLGCLEAVAPIQLNEVYNVLLRGHRESKWLHQIK